MILPSCKDAAVVSASCGSFVRTGRRFFPDIRFCFNHRRRVVSPSFHGNAWITVAINETPENEQWAKVDGVYVEIPACYVSRISAKHHGETFNWSVSWVFKVEISGGSDNPSLTCCMCRYCWLLALCHCDIFRHALFRLRCLGGGEKTFECC